MIRFAQNAGLAILAITLTAVEARTDSQQDGKKESKTLALSAKVAGTKLLVAFDRYSGRSADRKQRQMEFQDSLKQEGVRIEAQYRYGTYLLLQCGKEDPNEIIKKVPYHAGAIIFSDGKFVKSIAAHDNKKIPQKHAVLRWGSTAAAVKQMKVDIEKYSKMPGVVAKKINTAEGQFILGNPNKLVLTPSKGKTLLEIFLLAEAQFDHTNVAEK